MRGYHSADHQVQHLLSRNLGYETNENNVFLSSMVLTTLVAADKLELGEEGTMKNLGDPRVIITQPRL